MALLYAIMERVLLLALVLSGVSLMYAACIAIYNVFFHPLRRFPGPKIWAAFRLPYVIALQRGELHARMKEFHDAYGPIVRLAPDELSFTDARAWKDIYGNRPGHAPFERNRTWFKKATPDEPNSIMGFDEPDHARFRKIMVHAFSDKALKEQTPMIESYVSLLVDRLKERSSADLVGWLNYTTFDISGDLSFGESFDCLKNRKPHPWVSISYDFGKGIAMVSSVNHYPPIDKLLRYVLPTKVRQRMMDHKEMSRVKVHKRLDLTTERPDFTTFFMKQKNEQGDKGISVKEMELNMSILIFAGSETTASGLTGITRMVLQNREEMAKLVKELRASFQNESDITVTSVGRIKYLDAVINEGIRLCPPSTIGVPRVVPAGGDTICGEWIPPDTYVAVNQYAINRSPANFVRPLDFAPQRFLSESSKEFADDSMSAFQPFSIGRHSCIGQSLAYAEMRLILAKLFFVFDISLADDGDVWDWGKQKTFIFWEKEPLNVRLEMAKR